MYIVKKITFSAVIAIIVGLGLRMAGAWGAEIDVDVRQTWQLLDYIAVDYAGAVRDGKVIEAGEYAEMQEFAVATRTKLAALPPIAESESLNVMAVQLSAAIGERASPDDVSDKARVLANALMKAYRIEASPKTPPNVAQIAATYVAQCAACHGVQGNGDGPAAANLSPKPIAFTDKTRAAQRSPLSLYQVITQGLKGTSMASFAHLSEADRWALAFYVGGLAYGDDLRKEGEVLWREQPAIRQTIANLPSLTTSSEIALNHTLDARQAKAILAYLRAHPEQVIQQSTVNSSLALAKERLAQSLQAYEMGDVASAKSLALSSYLDGVEPVEPTLAARDEALLRDIEAMMAQLRDQLGRNATATDIQMTAEKIYSLFASAEAVLETSHTDTSTAFLGSFTILLREGLEAMLIVIGMIAFLRKAERQEVLPYVHFGWVSALVAGGLTWAAATHLVDISGANREVTEGLSSLFAAVVLLSVGIWMHQKSLAGRWQQYLEEKVSAALTRRSALFLFLLAFIAVYREVFETILFFIAMWNAQSASAIVAGLLAGTAALAVVAFLMLRASKRLPIGQFFSISSILIAVLAVVLVGKGVAALQEAGWVSQALTNMPRIDWLGIYPSWQSLLAQLAVLIVAMGGFVINLRSVK